MRKKSIYAMMISIISLLSLILFYGNSANAKVNQSSWVKDNSGVLNQKTINHIDKLNDDKLSKLKGHPEYAVITVKGIPNGDDIDDYAHDEGTKLGLGNKGWHNGLLLVVDTREHKYRLEVGTGLQGALPDGDKNSIVTSDVQKSLHAHDYNQAITKISNNTVNQLSSHAKDIITPEELKEEQQETQQRNKFIAILIFSILLLFLIGILVWFVIVKTKEYRREKLEMKQYEEIREAINRPEVKEQLKDKGIDNPLRIANQLDDEDKKRIFNNGTINTALLVSLLVSTYLALQNNDDDYYDSYPRRNVFNEVDDDDEWNDKDNDDDDDDDDDYHDSSFFGGSSSDDDSSFGDSFGGDFGGFDGGGFDGSF